MTHNTRGRPPKSHDNIMVQAWLSHYFDARDFCIRHPRAEDVLMACVRARTPRDTGRGLHTGKLFKILRDSELITSSRVTEILRCAARTARTYTIAAEIASRALAPLAADYLQTERVADDVPDLLAYEPIF